MSEQDEYADETYAEEFVEDEGETTWEQEQPADLTFEAGIDTALMANQAGFAHSLIQGQEDLRQQREYEQTAQQWHNEVAAAELNMQRPISEGEWAYLRWESQQPDSHGSIENALMDYQEQFTREERMTNSLASMHENAQPQTEAVLEGPETGYGLPEGASRQELRDARDAWSLQRQKILDGSLFEMDDES